MVVLLVTRMVEELTKEDDPRLLEQNRRVWTLIVNLLTHPTLFDATEHDTPPGCRLRPESASWNPVTPLFSECLSLC